MNFAFKWRLRGGRLQLYSAKKKRIKNTAQAQIRNEIPLSVGRRHPRMQHTMRTCACIKLSSNACFHSWNYNKVFPMFKLEATACYANKHQTHPQPSSVIMKTLGWLGVTHNRIIQSERLCSARQTNRQTNSQTNSQTHFAFAVFFENSAYLILIMTVWRGEAYFPLHLIRQFHRTHLSVYFYSVSIFFFAEQRGKNFI